MEKTWGRVLAALDENSDVQAFPDALIALQDTLELPGFISDLARLEWARHQIANAEPTLAHPPKTLSVNSNFILIPVAWKNLAALIKTDSGNEPFRPERGQAHVMIWRHPKTGVLHTREAGDIDLLALKIAVEQIDVLGAATAGHVNVRTIHIALDQAVTQGILMAPESRIRRAALSLTQGANKFKPFLTADIFTLQWHITQACDLHCKHCYDRSHRPDMSYDTAIGVLDNFYDFCRQMHVKGQVTFTGGNPLLYPRFNDIYRAASERGFGLAILGNPTPIGQIESLLDIEKPLYFQISLEGLAEHNDYIRGDSHFHRSLDFLDQLRRLDIYTMVMLTLTRDNLDQVLPLSDLLKDRADFFTFNRLSTVGEGAQLLMPGQADFETFIREYEAATCENPVLGLKDNLINIVRKEKETAPFGGCTGYGCGAAFNFVALLADGEVHACRKFPSPIGNITQTSLVDIYACDLAGRYRSGSEACRDCSLSTVCRGCFASTHSYALDVFKDRDPFCFYSEKLDI